jgi:hypothetical protein
MSYARFKFSEIANASAALAAVAALEHRTGPSAANAATAAGAQGKSEKFEHVHSPAPIPAFELQVAFETLVLARSSGVPDENARRNALTVFKAMIGNDARLVPPQPNPWRCVVCDEKGTANSPLVPVLTPNEGEHRWLHLGCHADYCRRQDATVETLVITAGLLPRPA